MSHIKEHVIDKYGNKVHAGDIVRVLKLPNVKLTGDELAEVETMLGEEFEVENISDGCVEVTKWWESDDKKWCHTLFLWSEEMELIQNNNDR